LNSDGPHQETKLTFHSASWKIAPFQAYVRFWQADMVLLITTRLPKDAPQTGTRLCQGIGSAISLSQRRSEFLSPSRFLLRRLRNSQTPFEIASSFANTL